MRLNALYARYVPCITAFAMSITPSRTQLLLIRHASHDWLGKKLAGRLDTVGINSRGEQELSTLAHHLASAGIEAIYVSPRRRARETAAPIAQQLGITETVDEDLDEIDFGAWSGETFEALADDPVWRVWRDRRTASVAPNGETITAAQTRVIERLAKLVQAHEGKVIAVITHADIIKAALAHYLRMSLDDLECFEIAPASISIVVTAAGRAQVKLVNYTASAFG